MTSVTPEPARRATSIDVAREAGVSQATVTRTFSSPELVAPATKRKVEDAARRIGYVPNAIARSLKSQRTDIIGAVVPTHGEYWQAVLTSLSQQLGEHGKQLLIFSFEDRSCVERALAAVRQYRLDGVILASSTIAHGQLGSLRLGAVPLVAFNQPAASGIIASVSVDNEGGMQALASHIATGGAEQAVYVGGVASASTDQQRYRGAVQELADHGIPCPYIEAGAYTYDAGYKAAQLVLERPERPDAVLVGSDEVAFGVIDGLRSGGVSVGSDISVTGFDGLPQASWAGYDLTTLVQPTDVLTRQAIDHVLSGDQNAVVDSVVAGTIRIGTTTRAVHG